MSFEAAAAAIREAIEETWTATPVYFANERMTLPATPARFIHVELLGNGGSMSVFGSDGKRVVMDDGILAIDLFVPKGTGESELRTMRLALAIAYQMRSFTGDGWRCRIYAAQRSGGGPVADNGNYYRVSLSFEFRVFYTA